MDLETLEFLARQKWQPGDTEVSALQRVLDKLIVLPGQPSAEELMHQWLDREAQRAASK